MFTESFEKDPMKIPMLADISHYILTYLTNL